LDREIAATIRYETHMADATGFRSAIVVGLVEIARPAHDRRSEIGEPVSDVRRVRVDDLNSFAVGAVPVAGN